MRHYTTTAFVEQVALKTKTPILVIQTDGSGASSLRYHDIAVDEEIRAQLIDGEQVFLTFGSADEANDLFDLIVREFPESGQTTLSLTLILGLPDGETREFEQIPGYERSFKIAA